jgi:hypothetical protein
MSMYYLGGLRQPRATTGTLREVLAESPQCLHGVRGGEVPPTSLVAVGLPVVFFVYDNQYAVFAGAVGRQL